MQRFMTADVVATLKSLGYGDSEIPALNPATLAYYQAMGYLPDGVTNYLALLGWSLDGKTEFFTLNDLTDRFSLENVHASPASFDPKKFAHINSLHMNRLTVEQKVAYVYPYLYRARVVPKFSEATPDQMGLIDRVVRAAGDRLKVCSAIVQYGVYFFRDPVYDEDAFKKRIDKPGVRAMLVTFRERLRAVPWEHPAMETAFAATAEEHGFKLGDLVHAVRIALTGQPTGPSVYDCVLLLDRHEAVGRIDRAIVRQTGAVTLT
jgi:glutamyl-tRNA synthetase